MVDTFSVGLACGLAHSDEKVIPSPSTSVARHQHGLAYPVINQLLSQSVPITSHTSPPERLNQFSFLHSQLQKPREGFADLKNGSFELARGSRGTESTTIKYKESITEANEPPINVFKLDASSWSSMVFANVRIGQDRRALDLYLKVQNVNVEPDSRVFVAVLKACSNLTNIEYGRQIHAHAIENGLELDSSVGSMLIDMYAKCGSLDIANVMFDKLPIQEMITWSALIAANIYHGHDEEALSLFHCLAQTEDTPMLDTVIRLFNYFT